MASHQPTTKALNKELANILWKGSAVILIGAGFASELGYPTAPELAVQIKNRHQLESKSATLEEVVLELEERGVSKHEIIENIKAILSERETESRKKKNTPDDPYYLLVTLLKAILKHAKHEGIASNIYLITTNWNKDLNNTLKTELGEPFSTIIDKASYYNLKPAHVKLYKAHGDLYENEGTVVLTKQDMITNLENRKALYTDIKSAMQNAPLIVIGYSYKDEDFLEIYDEVSKNIGKVEFYDVDIQEKPTIPGHIALQVNQSASIFLREVIEILSSNDRSLRGIGNLGVDLTIDKKIIQAAIESKGRSFILSGDPCSGKTLAIARARRKDSALEKYRHHEIDKVRLDDDDRALIKKELEQESVLLEGSGYAINYVLSEEPLVYEKSHFKKWKELLRKGANKNDCRNVSSEPYCRIEAKLNSDDADAIFEYYLKKIANGDKDKEGKLRKNKNHFFKLASYGKPPRQGKDHKGVFFPSLLIRSMIDYGNRDFDDLDKITMSVKEKEKYIAGILGLKIAEEAFFSLEDISKALEGITSFLQLNPFVSLAAIPLIGVSSVFGFYHVSKDKGFGEYVERFMVWNELPEEKRRVLCEALDKQYHLPPYSSYEFLSSWLTQNNKGTFENNLKNVFTESFIEEIQNTISKYPDLEETVESHSKKLTKLEERVDKCEERLDRIEKIVEERILPKPVEVKSATLYKEPGFEEYQKRHLIKSSFIGERVADAIRTLDEGKRVVILGEAGIGKTAFLYGICRSILMTSKHDLYTGDIEVLQRLQPSDIFFTNDITDEQRKFVERSSIAVIATCDIENWKTEGQQFWKRLYVSRKYFTKEILREIIIDCLRVEDVKSTDEGVEKALEQCGGSPGYLVELVHSCKAEGLTKTTASKAPAKIIGIIEKAVLNVRNPALKLLYALAISKESRVHEIQLQEFLSRSNASNAPDIPREFIDLTVEDKSGIFSLRNPIWKDVLLKDWKEGEEPHDLKKLRRQHGTIVTELDSVFRSSIPSLLKLTGNAAEAAARVALENQPSIFQDLHESILNSRELSERAHLVTVLELLAIRKPDVIKEYYRKIFQELPKIEDRVFLFILYAETLGFKTDNKYVKFLESDGVESWIPALPRITEFISPAYQALLLEEAANLLSERPEDPADDNHFLRAKLFDDLGSVKAILGYHDESLEATRMAVDEWRLACCSEEGVFNGYEIKFHKALVNLGDRLLDAGKNKEALGCLRASVRVAGHIRKSWSVFMKAEKTGSDGNVKRNVTDKMREELSHIVSFFQQMGDTASFGKEANSPSGPLPDFDGPYIGPLDEMIAFSSSLEHLAYALGRTGHVSEADDALFRALNLKNKLLSIYSSKSDFSAFADVQLEIAKILISSVGLRYQKIDTNGHPVSAGQILQDALRHYQELARRDDTFRPKVAKTLDLLANATLSEHAPGELEIAIATKYWTESEEILRDLASIHARFIIDHARVAGNLAELLEGRDVFLAIDYFQRAEGSLKNLPDTSLDYLTLMAQVAGGLGDAYSILMKWDKAIQYYSLAKSNWETLSSTEATEREFQAETMVGLGRAFIGKHEQESALDSLKKAVDLFKNIKDPDKRVTGSLANTLDFLGSTQADAGDRNGALDSYRDAQKILRDLPVDKPYNAASLANNLINIARLEEEMGKRKDAENDLNDAENILKPFLNPSGTPNESISFLFAVLGRAYKILENNSRSMICYQAALSQLQRLAEIDHRFIKQWAGALNDYAELLKLNRDAQEMVRLYQVSCDFLRNLRSPDEEVPDEEVEHNLMVTLANRGYWLLEADKTEDSIASYEEAAGISTRLARISDEYTPIHQKIMKGLQKANSHKATDPA